MATTMASGQKSAVVYTTGKGGDFVTSMKTQSLTTNGAVLGATAPGAGAAIESIPNGFKPRKARVVAADKSVRWTTVYTEAADAWTVVGTAVTLLWDGTDKVFYTDGTLRPEKFERKPVAAGQAHA